MRAVAWFVAWEWINISLEYTASSWVRLPHWLPTVVAVNLATHPAFSIVAGACGGAPSVVLPCEAGIVAVEALLLVAVYGADRWRRLLGVSLLMNAASYAVGLLLFP